MQSNVGRTTKHELLMTNALKQHKISFLYNSPPQPSLNIKVDFVIPELKVCIFLDGCFWHGCPIHFKPPGINTEWWKEKIADNKKRDSRQETLLKENGWHVWRFWEHEINYDSVGEISKRLTKMSKKAQQKN